VRREVCYIRIAHRIVLVAARLVSYPDSSIGYRAEFFCIEVYTVGKDAAGNQCSEAVHTSDESLTRGRGIVNGFCDVNVKTDASLTR
jgi:hypothetical protein